MKKGKIRFYTDREARKKGKRDGRDYKWVLWPFIKRDRTPTPRIDETDPTTEFEDELIKAAEANLNDISEEWNKEDKDLLMRCKNAEDRYKNADKKMKKEIAEYEGDEKIKGAIKEYEDAKKQFYGIPMPFIQPTVGLFLITIITAGECFFNAIVFNIFGQSQIHTWIMALGVMISIPVFASFMGAKSRLQNKSYSDMIIMIISGVIIMAGLAVIALLREQFLEATKLQETIGITLSSSTMGLSFYIINLLLFAAIFIIEYERAHKDPENYNKVKKILREAEKKLEKEAKEVRESIHEFEDAQREFNELHSLRTSKFQEIKDKAIGEKLRWIRLIQVYREANMAARVRDRTKPKVFEGEFDEDKYIKIPADLQGELNYCDKCLYLKLLTGDNHE